MSSKRLHTWCLSDWSSYVCSRELALRRYLTLSPAATVKTLYSGRCSGGIGRPVGRGFAVVANPSPGTTAVTPRSEERRVGKERRPRWRREHDRDERRWLDSAAAY